MELANFIRQRLKIRHLNVLVTLDDTLSVSRAAERLNVSQAAVSRTLAEAEAGFGLALFERHARGLYRTGPGQETLRAIRQILNDISSLETIASQHGTLTRGEINIGLHTVSALEQIAELVNGFKAQHPQVRIRLRDGLLPHLIEDMQNGRLDLVFGGLSPELDRKGLETRKMSEAEIMVIASSAVPLDAVSLPTLLERSWVLPLPGTPMRRKFDKLVEAAGCQGPSDFIESNNPLLIAEIVRSSGRLGICPKPIADLWSKNLALQSRQFEEEFTSEPIGLICLQGKKYGPAAAAFLKYHSALGDRH